MYEFKKDCEMETDKGTFEVVYLWFYSNIGSSNTKIGCNFGFATDFVYSLKRHVRAAFTFNIKFDTGRLIL